MLPRARVVQRTIVISRDAQATDIYVCAMTILQLGTLSEPFSERYALPGLLSVLRKEGDALQVLRIYQMWSLELFGECWKACVQSAERISAGKFCAKQHHPFIRKDLKHLHS